VELDGVTVLEPDVGTSPRPSIDEVVALVVFQVSVTCCPAVMASGEAEIDAVGCAAGGGAVAIGVCTLCLHPATATRQKSTAAEIENLVFESKAVTPSEKTVTSTRALVRLKCGL